MSKHVREKCGKLCISSILSSKRDIAPTKLTQIDDTRTWSVVQLNKVICKISAQYVKAFRRKLRKTLYFQYFKFQKGHNSYKNWRKSTKLELDRIRRKWHSKFQLDMSKHHHTIIRPVWRRAYKNFKAIHLRRKAKLYKWLCFFTLVHWSPKESGV